MSSIKMNKYITALLLSLIHIFDVREKTSLCDYFIGASGRSTQQVKALCENLEDKLSAEGLEPVSYTHLR